MPTYHYVVQRSNKPEDAVPGLTCQSAVVGGEITTSLEEMKRFTEALCCIPGKWTIRVRCKGRWLKDRTIHVMARLAK